MKKRILPLALALILAIALIPAALAADTSTVVFANDGVAKITDAENDQYFEGGSAREGVLALLNAGQVYVNNTKVPAVETETDSYVINGFSSLWKTEKGWAYSVHKLYSGEDLSFDDARVGFIEGISQMRGLTVDITLGANGYAEKLSVHIKESTLVNSITVNGDVTKIGRYDFALATDELRPDVNNVDFPTANVDPELKVGDIALYWFDGSEWYIEQAVGETGIVTKGTGEAKYILDGEAHEDALITRYNLQAANRTSQFLSAHANFKLEGIEATMWSTPTGYPIGFTRGENADEALALAITNATALKANYKISADGSDVAFGEKWVTAEAMAAYDAAIAEAQAVLDNAASTSIDCDMAIYNLSSALGSATGRKPSGLLAAVKTSDTLAVLECDGSTLITDVANDKYFAGGSALEGVEALLDAGKVYVNGFQVPVDETTTEFKVNGFTSLWKTETGWTNSVHKSQDSANLTFEENRMRFVQGLSKMAGLTLKLVCDDASGVATGIEFTIKETVLVDKIYVDGDTTKIDRSNFQLAHKPGMPDINNTVFKTVNVDPAIKAGDMALYWEAADGWHLEAATPVSGYLTDGKDHGWYEFNGEKYPDSGLTKYSLAKANRPGQYLVAHQNLGLTGIEVTMWQTSTGYPFGFTSGDNADEVLTLAIANAEKAKDGIKVAAEALAAYDAVIDEAKAALADAASSNADLDRAVYNLDQALKAFKAAEIADIEYTVAKGDCLWNLAVEYYGSGTAYTKIVEANGIKDPSLIYVGQKLVIPG